MLVYCCFVVVFVCPSVEKKMAGIVEAAGVQWGLRGCLPKLVAALVFHSRGEKLSQVLAASIRPTVPAAPTETFSRHHLVTADELHALRGHPLSSLRRVKVSPSHRASETSSFKRSRWTP
jgi:hypothetical protein